MTRKPIRWIPDDGSAAILAAYTRRALLLLARADGVLDIRGRVPRQGRRP
ncbi:MULTISPECIES: hypothetical protein [Streptomyces]|uniref:Uncharacterized protein n=1 Tax=Streptomyces griseosporeus TaxID=1910 RepID=A0ABV3KU87_STRGS|nr:hypothetical protein [Streptomyces actuosus]MBM4819806.1 hypothetical protein [Streptomyces actuosus]